jgi:hypothetical protein
VNIECLKSLNELKRSRPSLRPQDYVEGRMTSRPAALIALRSHAPSLQPAATREAAGCVPRLLASSTTLSVSLDYCCYFFCYLKVFICQSRHFVLHVSTPRDRRRGTFNRRPACFHPAHHVERG